MTLTYDYIFSFSEINRSGLVEVTECINNRVNQYLVCLYDDALQFRTRSSYTSEAADLIDLALSIHTVDRLTPEQHDGRLRLLIYLPIRNIEIFSSSKILDDLEHILTWYTGNNWDFKFTAHSSCARDAERQYTLPFEVPESEVALWSGGLDALAGFCKRAFAEPSLNYLLVGTGSNDQMLGKQRDILDLLYRRSPWSLHLLQPHFAIKEYKTPLPKSGLMRSRGLVFMLIGAATAYLQTKNQLLLYENGIGAINLAFRESEIGLDHARSVHPLSLMYISNLVSKILNEKFTISNPFLFQTKAQMCKIFHEIDMVDLPRFTISCDRRHRNPGEVLSCGRCSSCLLRRHALAVCGLEDTSEYVCAIFDPNNVDGPLHETDHFPAILHQVQRLQNCFKADDPWTALRKEYPELSLDIVHTLAPYMEISSDKMRDNLLHLYSNYVQEWFDIGYIVS